MPTRDDAFRLRDHIATFLQSDPPRAERLAAEFVRHVRSPRGAPHPPSAGALASAWRARAESCLYTGRLRAARSAYEKACEFASAGGEEALLGRILVGRIGTLLVMGDFHGAESLTPRAETLLRAGADDEYLRRLRVNVASGLYHRERFAEAAACMSGALELMDAAGQHDDVWASLTLNYGIALSQVGRVAEARDAFRRTESFGRARGQARMVAQAVFNRGALEALRGRYRDALRLIDEAAATLAGQDARELLAACRLEEAQIHLDLAMPAEGRALAGEAAAAFEAEGMLLDAELARLAEARSLLLLARPREAVARLAKSEAFYRARRIPARRAEALLHLARARAAQGDREAAIRTAEAALRLARRPGLAGIECACRAECAELEAGAGRHARAARRLAEFGQVVRHLPARERRIYWTSAARVALAAGDRARAAGHGRRAIQALEAERELIPGFELRAYSFEAGVRAYHDQIALLASSSRPSLDRVLALMERARGRAFGELLAGGGGAGSGDGSRDGDGSRGGDEIAERRAVLGSLLKRLDHLQAGTQPGAAREADALRREALALEREITALARKRESRAESAERRRAEGSARGAHGSGALVESVTACLAPREALVKYFVLEDRILAVAISRERQALVTLDAAPAGVKQRLDQLRLQLDSLAATAGRPVGNLAFLARSAESGSRELHRMLLEPALAALEDSRSGRDPGGGRGRIDRLTVVSHDFLHRVPFECLHDGDAWLDERFEIARCPTAGFLVGRRRRRAAASASGGAVVIAGTRLGSPFIEEEARGVARAWEVKGSRLLVDPAPADARQAMTDAAMIHVSAHGTFRADNPLFSTLHLGPDVLFLADILETRLAAGLVVLSACNTGQAFSGRGDALLGVAHAFLVAGAGRLVASLWRVHDRATAEWMEAFHHAARDGANAAAARRAASRELRGRWPHPFYWGGFCALGA